MPSDQKAGRSIRRLGAVATLCAIAICFTSAGPYANAADPLFGPPNIYAWTADNIDVDALAGRTKERHDLYEKIRDEALAAYAKAHPEAHPYDDDAKKLIRLMSYLYVWGDYDREGLWNIADEVGRKAYNAGGTDPFIPFVFDLYTDARTISSGEGAAVAQKAVTFAGTSYPLVLKEWYYQTAIDRVIVTRADPDGHLFADLLQKWGKNYRTLIKSAPPNSSLYCIGIGAESCVSDDSEKLTQVNDEIDKAFADSAPGNPVQGEIDGKCLIDEAWIARSGDWASNVKAEQWAKFGEYLSKADTVLEAAYDKHPEEAEISVLMLTVELGQGRGRDRMEQWFHRAIQADPQNAEAYTAKFWYLQPRWYGSEGDLVNFGIQNQDLQDPPLRVLGAFGVAIAQAADQDPDIYKRADVWVPIEKNYRLLLARFPQSIFVRTAFAKHAADSGRWKIAKEQLDILGDNWDRSVFKPSEYQKDVEEANANPNEDGPSPANSSTPSNGGSLTFLAIVWRIIKVFLPF